MTKMNNAGNAALQSRAKKLNDTNLLLFITVAVFILMYVGAMIFLKKGFLTPQTFLIF